MKNKEVGSLKAVTQQKKLEVLCKFCVRRGDWNYDCTWCQKTAKERMPWKKKSKKKKKLILSRSGWAQNKESFSKAL